MALVNIAFATAVLFAWPQVAAYLDAPLSLAADAGIASRPQFDEYPYVLLWSMPVIATLGSWIASRSGQFLFAKFLTAYPALVVVGAVIWYHYLSMIYA
jgi:hypothetical protein